MQIISNMELSAEEKQAYIDYAREKYGDVYKLELNATDDGFIEIKTHYNKINLFSRIRRITGYLTQLVKCNNAKTQEIKERVKHDV